MSLIETYSNNYSTTLSGSITSGATSLVVASTAGEPLAPQFRSLIDSELILTTSMAGTTWTITRGIEGTTAAAHSSGATITHVLTSGGLVGVAGSVSLSGAFANIPTAGVIGRTYRATDGIATYFDNGVNWNGYGPSYLFTDPTTPSWVWVNQGAATVASTGGFVFLHAPGNASPNARIRKIAAPSTPYTITAYIDAVSFSVNFHQYGLVFRESSTSKLHTFDCYSDTTLTNAVRVSEWSSETNETTSFNATTTPDKYRWLQITDDGTNRIYRLSRDGLNWIQFYTEGRTTFLTANEVGFYANALNTSAPDIGLTLYSWKQT